MKIQTKQPSTIAKTALERAGSSDTNEPVLELPVPGEDRYMTVEESVDIDQADAIEAAEREQARLANMEAPPPISEEDYGEDPFMMDLEGPEQAGPTGQAYETPTPVLANAVLNAVWSDEQEGFDTLPTEEKAVEQRKRERLKSIPELWGVKTLAGIHATVNDKDNLMYGPMYRAARMGNTIAATKMTAKVLEKWQETKDPDKAFTARKAGDTWSAKYPAIRGKGIETDQTTILYHPELLDAGLWDANLLGEGKGGIALDKDFLQTTSLVTEQFYVNAMNTRAEEEFEEVTDTSDPEGGTERLSLFTKSEGRKQLGKEIFRQWKRVQATKRGTPTDAYAENFSKINDEVFEQIGDFAKESYALVNPDLMDRRIETKESTETNIKKDSKKEQVKFILKREGEKLFADTYYMYSAMFGANEVAPMVAPAEDLEGEPRAGQLIYEGLTYTRRTTTQIHKEIGNTDAVFEAMANMNKVVISNDPQRERAAFMYAGAAITTAGNPELVKDQQANDFNERALSDMYFSSTEFETRIVNNGVQPADPLWIYEPTDPYYANMFGIGKEKFESLLQEKARLYNAAMDMEEKGRAINETGWGFDLWLSAKAYSPKTILDKEREKLMSILDGANRYSGRKNYLTFAMQALTGRMHSQQTIYNPQAHKALRYIIGGGNTYQWTPGKGNSGLDRNFREAMSAHLFENPKVEGIESFKKKYGVARPPQERLNVFQREQDNANNPDSLWMKYVRWGEQLEKIVDPFNAKASGALFSNFVNASGNPQARQGVIQQLQTSFNTDPLPPDLKAFLAKYEEESILMTDYLINLAKYHRVTQHNKKGEGPPQVFRSSIVLEIDGRTHGPATLATLLGSEKIAKRSGIIMKQDFQDMLNGDYKDMRDAMMDAMDNSFDKIAGGISFIREDQRDWWRAILQEAFEDRENFLKKSPMTMGYGQEIQSLRQHVDTTVFQSKKIQDIVNEQRLQAKDVVDFLHTMLVSSIYDTMDESTIRSAKLIKTTGYLSALTGVLFQVPQPTGILSTIAGRDSRIKGSSSYTLVFQDPETGEIKKPVDSGQMNVTQYESVTTPAAIRKMFGQEVLGGYATGRLLPALVQAFDANMVTGVFTDRKVGKFIGFDKNGTPKYEKNIPTGNWARINKAAKEAGATNTFVLPIFDAFMTDLGTNEVVRKVANKVYQDSLVNGRMMEKVIEYYDNILTPTVRGIKDNESYTWSDPGNDFHMLKSIFSTVPESPPTTKVKGPEALADAIKKLSWSEEMKWKEGKETLGEWNSRTKRESRALSTIIFQRILKKFQGTGLSLKESYEALHAEKITGKRAKILLGEIIGVLNTRDNMIWAKKTIPERRAAIAEAIRQGWVANIDHAY